MSYLRRTVWSAVIMFCAVAAVVPLGAQAASPSAGVRSVLTAFDQAAIQGKAAVARTYLAPGFKGTCGPKVTHARNSLMALLCHIGKPLAFNILTIHTGKVGTASAVVLYLLPLNRRLPLAFNLTTTKGGWRISQISFART